MILTKEQADQMLEAAKPLLKFINDNCHPHVCVIVDGITVQLFESAAVRKTTEFLKD